MRWFLLKRPMTMLTSFELRRSASSCSMSHTKWVILRSCAIRFNFGHYHMLARKNLLLYLYCKDFITEIKTAKTVKDFVLRYHSTGTRLIQWVVLYFLVLENIWMELSRFVSNIGIRFFIFCSTFESINAQYWHKNYRFNSKNPTKYWI